MGITNGEGHSEALRKLPGAGVEEPGAVGGAGAGDRGETGGAAY